MGAPAGPEQITASGSPVERCVQRFDPGRVVLPVEYLQCAAGHFAHSTAIFDPAAVFGMKTFTDSADSGPVNAAAHDAVEATVERASRRDGFVAAYAPFAPNHSNT